MLGRLWLAYRCWNRRRLRRKAGQHREVVARFVATRQPQSDAEFFAECLPGAPPEWIRWSTAVRWAIARLGRVHPRFIRPDDRFVELMAQLGWCERDDSLCDPVGLIMLIEEATDLSFRDEEIGQLPNVYNYDLLTGKGASVREFVQRVVEICAAKSDFDTRGARRLA